MAVGAGRVVWRNLWAGAIDRLLYDVKNKLNCGIF
jgi:hypothetical protein